jgi:hypothetical protein
MKDMGEGQNRRAFLGQVGRTLAAAFGVALIPQMARAAKGHQTSGSAKSRQTSGSGPLTPVTWTCYVDSQTCGHDCGGCKARYRCIATGCDPFCTGCQDVCTKHDSYSYSGVC